MAVGSQTDCFNKYLGVLFDKFCEIIKETVLWP